MPGLQQRCTPQTTDAMHPKMGLVEPVQVVDPNALILTLRGTGASCPECIMALKTAGFDPFCSPLLMELAVAGLMDASRERLDREVAALLSADPAFGNAVFAACGHALETPADSTFMLFDSSSNFFRSLQGVQIFKHLGKSDCQCTDLETLPDGFVVGGNLALFGFGGLKDFPKKFKVGGSLTIGGCASLGYLPGGLNVGGDLLINDCRTLKALPEGLTVGRNLQLDRCIALEKIQGGVVVGEGILLRKCTAIQELPNDLRVRLDLCLDGCSNLRCLPKHLRVGGFLKLEGCDKWDGIIPRDAQIGRAIYTNVHPNGIRLKEWRERYAYGSCFGKQSTLRG